MINNETELLQVYGAVHWPVSKNPDFINYA